MQVRNFSKRLSIPCSDYNIGMALNPGRGGGGSGGAGGNVRAPGSPGSGFKPNSAQAAPIDSEMARQPRRQRRLLEVEGRTNLSIDYNDHTFKVLVHST